MKSRLAAAALAGLLAVLFQAQGTGATGRASSVPPEPLADWREWTRPLAAATATPSAEPVAAAVLEEEIDVVDAHWMALTMWGEARSDGEEGMRAVGHVIRNRWQAKKYGDYVTDTVSAAWQFSCWNPGDPNRAAMLAIDDLPEESEGRRLWRAAKEIANEILAGRSEDPTGGALFYHTAAIRPKWAAGMVPSVRIGEHLFYERVG